MKPIVPYSVFIDDERFPKTDCPVGSFWVICRNKKDFENFIAMYGLPQYISFDHDLGENEPTGKDIANYIVELWLDEKVDFSTKFNYNVHSANNIGRDNIQGLLDNFINFKSRDK